MTGDVRYPLGNLDTVTGVDGVDRMLAEEQSAVRRRRSVSEPPPSFGADPWLVPEGLWRQAQKKDILLQGATLAIQQDGADLAFNVSVQGARERFMPEFRPQTKTPLEAAAETIGFARPRAFTFPDTYRDFTHELLEMQTTSGIVGLMRELEASGAEVLGGQPEKDSGHSLGGVLGGIVEAVTVPLRFPLGVPGASGTAQRSDETPGTLAQKFIVDSIPHISNALDGAFDGRPLVRALVATTVATIRSHAGTDGSWQFERRQAEAEFDALWPTLPRPVQLLVEELSPANMAIVIASGGLARLAGQSSSVSARILAQMLRPIGNGITSPAREVGAGVGLRGAFEASEGAPAPIRGAAAVLGAVALAQPDAIVRKTPSTFTSVVGSVAQWTGAAKGEIARLRAPVIRPDVEQLQADRLLRMVVGGNTPDPTPPGGTLRADPSDALHDLLRLTPPGEQPHQQALQFYEGRTGVFTEEALQALGRGNDKLAAVGWGVEAGERVPLRTVIPGVNAPEDEVRGLFHALHNRNAVEAGDVSVPAHLREVYDDIVKLVDWEQASTLNFDPDSAIIDDYFYRGWRPPEDFPSGRAAVQTALGSRPGFRLPRKDWTFDDFIAAGFEPLSWNPYEMVTIRRLQGVMFREGETLIERLRAVDMAIPIGRNDPIPAGWDVPKAGPAFEGRPFAYTDGDGKPRFGRSNRWAVPTGALMDAGVIPPQRSFVNEAKELGEFFGSFSRAEELERLARAAHAPNATDSDRRALGELLRESTLTPTVQRRVGDIVEDEALTPPDTDVAALQLLMRDMAEGAFESTSTAQRGPALFDTIETMFGKPIDLIVNGRDVAKAIDAVAFGTKRFKLFGSLFQQADFGRRTMFAGFAGALNDLAHGKPLEAVRKTFVGIPSDLGSLIRANAPITGPGFRQHLAELRLNTDNLMQYTRADGSEINISFRSIGEAGWSTHDRSIFPREFKRVMDDLAKEAVTPAQKSRLAQIEAGFQNGLFEGVYPAAQIASLRNFIVPALVRQHGDALTDAQLSSMAAKAVNMMFGTLGESQHVALLDNKQIRWLARRALFSTNEQETLLRQAAGTIKGPNASLWRQYYLAGFLSLAAVANAMHFAATGQALPPERYNPFTLDGFSVLPVGYRSSFLSPDVPGVKGRHGAELSWDFVGQMDTAFRLLDPAGFVTARFSAPVRAGVNQGFGEDFFGRDIDDVGPKGIVSRARQLADDLFTPIGAGNVLQLSRSFVPGAADVIPENEGRLGVWGSLIQVTGENIRAESTPELLERFTQEHFPGRRYSSLGPHERVALLDVFPELEAELAVRRDFAAAAGSEGAVRALQSATQRTEEFVAQTMLDSDFVKGKTNPITYRDDNHDLNVESRAVARFIYGTDPIGKAENPFEEWVNILIENTDANDNTSWEKVDAWRASKADETFTVREGQEVDFNAYIDAALGAGDTPVRAHMRDLAGLIQDTKVTSIVPHGTPVTSSYWDVKDDLLAEWRDSGTEVAPDHPLVTSGSFDEFEDAIREQLIQRVPGLTRAHLTTTAQIEGYLSQSTTTGDFVSLNIIRQVNERALTFRNDLVRARPDVGAALVMHGYRDLSNFSATVRNPISIAVSAEYARLRELLPTNEELSSVEFRIGRLTSESPRADLVAAFAAGATYNQIATQIGSTPEAVEQRLRRAANGASPVGTFRDSE